MRVGARSRRVSERDGMQTLRDFLVVATRWDKTTCAVLGLELAEEVGGMLSVSLNRFQFFSKFRIIETTT